jgi:hypothetical protein
MHFMVQSRQRPNMTGAETDRMHEAMAAFYANIPHGVTLECDYVHADKLGAYSVLRVPNRATLDGILAPFDGLVVVRVVEVLATTNGLPDG